MKHIITRKERNYPYQIITTTVYFDDNVFEFFNPKLNPTEEKRLLRNIANYLNGKNNHVYVKRIYHADFINNRLEVLFKTGNGSTFFDPQIGNRYLSTAPERVTFPPERSVFDNDENNPLKEVELSEVSPTEVKKLSEAFHISEYDPNTPTKVYAELSAKIIAATNFNKIPEQWLPKPLLVKTEDNENVAAAIVRQADIIEKRFKLPSGYLAKHISSEKDLAELNKTLAEKTQQLIEPVQQQLQETKEIANGIKYHVSEPNHELLKLHMMTKLIPVVSEFKKLGESIQEQVNTNKSNLENAIAEKPEALIGKLNQLNFGNDIELIDQFKKRLIRAIYCAGYAYLINKWNPAKKPKDLLAYRYELLTEINKKFSPIFVMDDLARPCSLQQSLDKFTDKNLAFIQTTVDCIVKNAAEKNTGDSFLSGAESSDAIKASLSDLLKDFQSFFVSNGSFKLTESAYAAEKRMLQQQTATDQLTIFSEAFDIKASVEILISFQTNLKVRENLINKIKATKENIYFYKEAVIRKNDFENEYELFGRLSETFKRLLPKLKDLELSVDQYIEKNKSNLHEEFIPAISAISKTLETSLQAIHKTQQEALAEKQKYLIFFDKLSKKEPLTQEDIITLNDMRDCLAKLQMQLIEIQHGIEYQIAQLEKINAAIKIPDKCKDITDASLKQYNVSLDEIQLTDVEVTRITDNYANLLNELEHRKQRLISLKLAANTEMPGFNTSMINHIDSHLDKVQREINTITRERGTNLAQLRCQLIVNALLNFEFWTKNRKWFGNERILYRDSMVKIPSAIAKLLKIATNPKHCNWSNEFNAAKKMLDDLKQLATKQARSSNPEVAEFCFLISHFESNAAYYVAPNQFYKYVNADQPLARTKKMLASVKVEFSILKHFFISIGNSLMNAAKRFKRWMSRDKQDQSFPPALNNVQHIALPKSDRAPVTPKLSRTNPFTATPNQAAVSSTGIFAKSITEIDALVEEDKKADKNVVRPERHSPAF